MSGHCSQCGQTGGCDCNSGKTRKEPFIIDFRESCLIVTAVLETDQDIEDFVEVFAVASKAFQKATAACRAALNAGVEEG